MPEPASASLSEAFAKAAGVSAEAAKDSSKLLEIANQGPIVQLVSQVLNDAVARRASDIHVETFEDHVNVRYRIDGICYPVARPPKSLALAIASRLKILASLDVAESRLPQDGRILLTTNEKSIDLRVSTLPTIHGESIVMRILDKSSLNKTLDQLGMGPDTERAIEALIRRPHGLFLVTGPTGSGKTTTLYACLTALNKPEVKIITTEDPVEYDIAGLVQIAINQKISLDFATCLRAILRHDPDIVMVGEIRDAETAQVAVQAALTGHLVFSTLHTNDAPGAVTRLLDMGLEPFLITSTVSAVLAQRLVRRLCPQCHPPVPPTEEELAALRGGGPPPAPPVHAEPQAPGGSTIVQHAMEMGGSLPSLSSCPGCQGTGFQGRVGLYELLPMNDAIRPLVLERKAVSEIRQAACAAGMKTLREAGVEKAMAGQTSAAEILRETQDYG